MEESPPPFGRIFPSVTDAGSSVDIDAIRSELVSTIAEVSAINEGAENEIAFDLAECIAECTIVNEDCDRCVAGLIDHEINYVNSITSAFDQRVRNAVDRDVSEVVGILMSLGVPITELFPSPDEMVSSPTFSGIQPGDLTATDTPVVPPSPPPVLPALPPVNPTTQPPASPQIPEPIPPFEVLGQSGLCVNGQPVGGGLNYWLNASSDNIRFLDARLPNWRDTLFDSYAAGTPVTVFVSGNNVYTSLDGTCPPVIRNPDETCGQTVTVSVTVGPTGTATTVTPPVSPPPSITPSLCDPENAGSVLEQVASLKQTFTGDPAETIRAIGLQFGPPPGEDYGFFDFISNPLPAASSVVGSIVTGVVRRIISTFGGDNILGTLCTGDAFAVAAAQGAAAGLFGGWFGTVPPAILANNQYTQNLICQYLVPSGPEANSLRSRGLLTESQWRLIVHANGLCEPWQKIIVDGMASVPTIDESNRAFKAEYINEETYRDYMRRNGVVNTVDIETFARLGEFVPGPSDLVRFMVRDSFDEQVVAEGGLDNGFAQKFTGRAKEWAAAQGMDEDQFRYFWRSHWSYPSNTQLYEMLHRLRTDTPIPGSNRTAQAVSVEQVKRVLEINDIAPEWVDRLLAISYRPLTRVDARRAYELGDLDREGLLKSYLDLGYAPENAETLVSFAETSSGPIRAKKLGYASTSEVLSWYRDAVISSDLAREKLRQSGVPDQNISRYLETEDGRVTSRDRKAVLKATQRRYNAGEFSAAQATEQLSRAGIDPLRIGGILFQWSVLRDSKYKAPTVAMLCKWWAQGIITIQEWERRLTNLGYSLVDASRIQQTCQNQEQERLAKEAEKFAKDAVAAEEKRLRKEKAAQREAERLAEKLRPCKPPPKPICPAPDSARNGQG